MVKLAWNATGHRLYEMGVDRGVVYSSSAVPWNGLRGVDEIVSGGQLLPYFYDGVQYLTLQGGTDFQAKVSAFTYPEELDIARTFGFAYRTLVGNELVGDELGYRIRLVYDVSAVPGELTRATKKGDVDPANFIWSLSGRPQKTRRVKQTAFLTIDSRSTHPELLAMVEAILYGTNTTAPRLPSPDELRILFGSWRTGYGYGPYGHTTYGHGPSFVP